MVILPNFIQILGSLYTFTLICDAFRLRLSPQSFPFYYNYRSTHIVGWLSLTSLPCGILFTLFTSSYENFKERYFKFFVKPDGKPDFYDSKGKPKSPFHWTQSFTHYSSWSRSSMTP